MILLALTGWLVAIVAIAAVIWQRRELRSAYDRARLMEDEAGFWQERVRESRGASDAPGGIESPRRRRRAVHDCTVHAGAAVICLATGRLTFSSPDDAERRRQRIKRKRGSKSPALGVFKCAACRHWHLGHTESWQKHRKTRRVA